MAPSGFMLVIQRSITLSSFKLVRFLTLLVQNVVWNLDGTAQKAKDAFKPENYEHCVRVLNSKACRKFDVFQPITLGDFIYTHDRFESPQYIFDNDHVSLITINHEYVIFGEAREKTMELWRSEYSPFVRMAQLDFCNKLLVVPMDAFHRMADQLGDPKAEIVVMFNTTRCGSTLFTQMMEYSGKCVAISEPEPPNILTLWYRNIGDSEELRRVARSSMRWICRPYKKFQPLTYVVKLSGATILMLELYKELYPKSRYLFMYRDLMATSKSVYKATREMPTLVLAMLLGRIHGFFTEKCVDIAGYVGKDFRVRFVDDITLAVVLFIYMAKGYLDRFHGGGLNIGAVRYEDIISDPIFACKAILRHCNLPESLAEEAVKGLKQDSQRNSPLSRKILQRHRDPIVTKKGREVANALLRKNGIPTLEEETLLPGTITVKPK